MESKGVKLISNTIPTEVKPEEVRTKSEPITIKAAKVCKCEWCKEDRYLNY